jgi:hypothetical protein
MMIKQTILAPRVFAAVIVLLHAVYFVFAYFFNANIYTQDSTDYLSQAHNIINHHSLYAAPWNEPTKIDWFTFRPPVYALFIIVCKSIVNSDYFVLLVQNLLSIVTFMQVARFANQFISNPKFVYATLIAVGIFYPSQFIHCNLIMSDVLFQFILLFAFVTAYKLWLEPTFKNAFICSIWFVVAMLTKPVSFMLGFTLVIVLAFGWFKQNKLKYLLPFILLPITYHTYCSYNKYVTGYYHYTSVTPYFVLKYMAKYTNAQVYGEHYADSIQDVVMMQADAQPTYALRYQTMLTAGKAMIAENPMVFAWFNIKGWIAFMVDPGRFEWYRFLNISEDNFPGLYHLINTVGFIKGINLFLKQAPIGVLLVLALSLLFNVVVFVLFILSLFVKQLPPLLRIFLFLFVAYIVLSTGVLGLSRYRIAVAPLLWIGAMHAWYFVGTKK